MQSCVIPLPAFFFFTSTSSGKSIPLSFGWGLLGPASLARVWAPEMGPQAGGTPGGSLVPACHGGKVGLGVLWCWSPAQLHFQGR